MNERISIKNVFTGLLGLSLLAILTGIVAGFGAVAFRGLIAIVHNLLFLGRFSYVYDSSLHTSPSPWGPFVILVPIVGAICVAFLVKNFAPEAKGHGVPEVMDAIYYNQGIIRPVVAVIKSIASAISPASEGLGVASLSRIFAGGHVPAFTALWKAIATSVTLGFGGSGGIVTPLFVVGVTSGSALAKLMGLSIVLLGAFWMVAVVAAGANTPIAASVMALELFGPEIGTYAAISCLTAYIVVGHRSVYPSQILGASKSPSIELSEPSARIDEMPSLVIHPRRHSILYLIGLMSRSHKHVRVNRRPTGKY